MAKRAIILSPFLFVLLALAFVLPNYFQQVKSVPSFQSGTTLNIERLLNVDSGVMPNGRTLSFTLLSEGGRCKGQIGSARGEGFALHATQFTPPANDDCKTEGVVKSLFALLREELEKKLLRSEYQEMDSFLTNLEQQATTAVTKGASPP